jgi:hypothetical protein
MNSASYLSEKKMEGYMQCGYSSKLELYAKYCGYEQVRRNFGKIEREEK